MVFSRLVKHGGEGISKVASLFNKTTYIKVYRNQMNSVSKPQKNKSFYIQAFIYMQKFNILETNVTKQIRKNKFNEALENYKVKINF